MRRCEAAGNGGRLQMIPGTILTFVPLLLGLFAAQPTVVQQSVTRLIVQDEIILRVPIQPRPLLPRFDWVERKGPKCIDTGVIRGALLSNAQQVDFLTQGPRRIRAELDEDCPALDFYGGFYLQPQDQRLCAGRDAIHSRMGGSCTIQEFKQLIPKFRR
ncbi:MAG TPA: hypothetical protein VIK68_00210 [Sphingomicrobium sp.]